MISIIVTVGSEREQKLSLTDMLKRAECHFLVAPTFSRMFFYCHRALTSVQEDALWWGIMKRFYNSVPNLHRFPRHMVIHDGSGISSTH